MYFLMSLFLIRLAAPVTMRVLRVESFQAFVLLFLTIHAAYRLTFQPAAVFLSIEGGQEPILHAWWGAQFYLMGIALYRFLRPAYDKKALSLSLAVFSCGLLLNSHFGFGALKDWVQYSYLIVFFLLARVFPRRSLLGDIIGRNTMGIYLVHAPVLLKGISLLLNKAVANPILSFLSILFATVAVSLLAALLFKTLPLGAFLFGETAERAG
jgi:surface polysaccharide O-acyltransferase-like enzyme